MTLRASCYLAMACVGALATAAQAAPSPRCSVSTNPFAGRRDSIEGYRVVTGPDGDSQVEPLRIATRDIPLLKTGKLLGMLELPTSPKRGVEIVMGPPNVDLPMHPAPGKEMFVLLGGSITFKTAKFSTKMGPGTVLLFEDTDAKIGHGGRTGPCGYVSLSIAP